MSVTIREKPFEIETKIHDRVETEKRFSIEKCFEDYLAFVNNTQKKNEENTVFLPDTVAVLEPEKDEAIEEAKKNSGRAVKKSGRRHNKV